MRGKELMDYIDDRIQAKLFSKIAIHEIEVASNFKLRHGNGLLDHQQACALVEGSIRDLKVWREISKRLAEYEKYR